MRDELDDRTTARIRDDDTMIDLLESLKILGGKSVSAGYDDAELMGLKISMSPAGRRSKMIRFILREVHDLRRKRVAQAEAKAPDERARVEARIERRRAKRRMHQAASTA